MWADFLSHFSEISNIDGAENYTVIKQKPADHDLQQSQAHHVMDEEVKDDTTPPNSKPIESDDNYVSSSAAAASSASDDTTQSAIGFHQRRISRLDNDQKFKASLDKVQIKKENGDDAEDKTKIDPS